LQNPTSPATHFGELPLFAASEWVSSAIRLSSTAPDKRNRTRRATPNRQKQFCNRVIKKFGNLEKSFAPRAFQLPNFKITQLPNLL